MTAYTYMLDEPIMRILLVEDDPIVRTFLLRALAYAAPGCTVEAVVDGSMGLAAFQREPADLVISDQHMPNLTGLELLRAIRAISTVPFVLISANTEFAAAARAAGCSSFIAKPLSLDELRHVIANLCPTP